MTSVQTWAIRISRQRMGRRPLQGRRGVSWRAQEADWPETHDLPMMIEASVQIRREEVESVEESARFAQRLG